MILLETQYLPSIAWCSALWQEQQVVLEASEHYQKGALRNRCFIAGPNGPQRLSIPLEKGKHQQTPIREVRISYAEPWQRQHWRSIQAAYGNAPFFEHYEADIQPFYSRKWDFLFDYNLEWIELILKKKLGWDGNITFQSTYFLPGQWPLGLDLRGRMLADLSHSPKPYAQVFAERSGFIPNLSVLDLLFCCGKTGGEVLAQSLLLPN